uniref:Class I SAM-dependent methyltransferase n=1 Tax=candidate division WOR-3 bacterium TaxID=2052148 RepID=A0A7V0Z6P6_UNCW3
MSIYQFYKQFWTPQYWRNYCEREDPLVKYRQNNEREILSAFLKNINKKILVLEAGCGYGRISRIIKENPNINLIVSDLSSSMVAECIGKTTGRVIGCVANIEELPFKDSIFDGVLCTGVLMHLEDENKALFEMARVLKKNGFIIISVNNILSPFSPAVILHTILKRNYIQRFRTPAFCISKLHKNGFFIENVCCDTIFGLRLNVLKLKFPPSILLPIYRLMDKIAQISILRYLGYELWFFVRKSL